MSLARAMASASIGDRVQAHHRAERFTAVGLHVGRDVGEHGGLEDVAADVGAVLAAGEDGSPLLDRVLDVAAHGLELGTADEGTDLVGPVETDTQPQRRGCPGQPPGELVVEAVVDVDALQADAQLAGAGEAAADGAVHRRVEVGVVEDDHRVLAAEFQRAAHQPLRGFRGDEPAGGGAAGEAQEVDLVEDRLAQLGAPAGKDVQEVAGQAGLDPAA